MPRMTITAVDGKDIEVTSSAALKSEIERYEMAIEALLPDLESTDDAVGERAHVRYEILAARQNLIIDRSDEWNRQVVDENREQRKVLAANIRERRRRG